MSDHLTITSIDENGDARNTRFIYQAEDAQEAFGDYETAFGVECGKLRGKPHFCMDLFLESMATGKEWFLFPREYFKDITGLDPKTHKEYAEMDAAFLRSVCRRSAWKPYA